MFDEAKLPQLDRVLKCRVCDGGGFYSYDHNHSTPCPVCCEHENYYIRRYGQSDTGQISCSMCGTLARDEPWQLYLEGMSLPDGNYGILEYKSSMKYLDHTLATVKNNIFYTRYTMMANLEILTPIVACHRVFD